MALINTTTTGILGTTLYGDGAGALTVQKDGVTQAIVTNAPAFWVTKSAGNQSISSSTFTKVTLDNERFDTANCFDTSTSRFTPNVAGYYQINGQVQFGPWPSSTSAEYLIVVYKNGAEFERGMDPFAISVNSGGYATAMFSSLIYFNGTTDYVELYVYQSFGTVNIVSHSSVGYCRMFGHLVKAV